MESINNYLKDDEKILFQKSLINPKHKKNRKAMFIIGGISLLLIVPFIICCILGLFYPLYFILSILLILASVMFGLFSLALFLPYYKYMKALQMSFKQIKSYEDLYVLTNKRWIQKCLDVLNIHEDTFPLEIVKYDDLVFIDIKQIKSFFIQPQDSAACYFIGFDLKFPYGQGLYIPYSIFPEFITILKEIIPISREVHGKRGFIYYYQE